MNVQNILTSLSQNSNAQGSNSANQAASPLDSIASMLPGGLAGGAAAGGIMALLMGSKSTRKIAKKVVKYGGTAIVGGLAYKAYGNWQKNKALGQTKPVTPIDIEQASTTAFLADQTSTSTKQPIELILINTMIAASKADGNIDAQEHQRLFEAIGKSNITDEDKAMVFSAMSRDISIQELADSVTLDEHKAEVYLSAYLAIEVDNQLERTFLNNLAIALNLPRGFPAYLEQQADLGVES